jgi:hypothetical protein
MPTVTNNALDELAELKAQAERRRQAPDEIRQERDRLNSLVESAKQDLRHFHATNTAGGQQAKERKLTQAMDKAIANADQPWQQRIESAHAARLGAQDAIKDLIDQNLDRLIGEKVAAGAEVRDEFINAVRHVAEARARFQAESKSWQELFGDDRAVPDFPVSPRRRAKFGEYGAQIHAAVTTLEQMLEAGAFRRPVPFAFDPEEQEHRDDPTQRQRFPSLGAA